MKKRFAAVTALFLSLAFSIAPPSVAYAKAGWNQDYAGWYYQYPEGGWATNQWIRSGGKWYYLGSDGYMKSNDWVYYHETQYWLTADGSMATGWAYAGRWDDYEWYWFDDAGLMAKGGWRGNYYLMGDGRMAKSRWIDGYYVGEDGKWVPGRSKGAYVGLYGRYGGPVPSYPASHSFVYEIDVRDQAGDTITFDISYSNWHIAMPYSLNDVTVTLNNGVGHFSYDDDGFGDSGHGTISFARDGSSVHLSIAEDHHGAGSRYSLQTDDDYPKVASSNKSFELA